MKVALLVPGGVDRSGTHRVIPCLLWQVERLVAAGHEIHVFAHAQEPEPGSWPLLGATVHNAGRRPRRARMLGQLLVEHRRAPFHLLHAVWASPAGVVAAAAGCMLNRPVLLHLTGGDLTDLREIGFGARSRWQGRAWVRFAVAGATHVTVPSTLLLEQARALGIRAERLPYGVALDRWPPRAPRHRASGEEARLLHVGSLNRVKDQPTLLRAAAALRSAGVPFRLDVVGEDTLGGEVQRLAEELSLGNVVRFHGCLPHSELRGWMEHADLLLLSSRHEADPIVLLEAAVAGVPTVGTAVGHLLDWAPDSAAAVPVGDAAALARETSKLLANEELRLGMAERAQRRALAEDADRCARRLDELYLALAARDGSQSPHSVGRRYPISTA